MEDNWNLFDSFIEEEPKVTKEDIVCFNCESEDLLFDSEYSFLTCKNCGVIVCTLLDKKNEATMALVDGSNISHFLPKSSLGTSISGNPRMKIRKVNDWWKWEYKEKAFYDDKKFIEDKCYNAKLHQAIVDNALNLYKRISETRDKNGKYFINRGINRIGLMAASVYYGSKMQKQPRSPKEIAVVFGLKQTEMTKGCKRFLALIDHKVLYNTEMNETKDFVERYCNKLGLDHSYYYRVIELIKNIDKLQIATNHQPPSVAAAAILLTVSLLGNNTEISLNKKKLHALFKISEVTITKTYNKIYPWLRLLMDSEQTEIAAKELTTKFFTDDDIYEKKR